MAMATDSTEQRFTPWPELRDVGRPVWFEHVKFEASDLVVLIKLEPSPDLLELHFDAPIAFRGVGETYRLRTWNEAPEAVVGFHQVQHSEFISWLRIESGGVLDERQLHHFAILTPDDCLEVITEFPPSIKAVPCRV
jgi:hypothetical protein